MLSNRHHSRKGIVFVDTSPDGIEWMDAAREHGWHERQLHEYRQQDVTSRISLMRIILALAIPWWVRRYLAMRRTTNRIILGDLCLYLSSRTPQDTSTNRSMLAITHRASKKIFGKQHICLHDLVLILVTGPSSITHSSKCEPKETYPHISQTLFSLSPSPFIQSWPIIPIRSQICTV